MDDRYIPCVSLSSSLSSTKSSESSTRSWLAAACWARLAARWAWNSSCATWMASSGAPCSMHAFRVASGWADPRGLRISRRLRLASSSHTSSFQNSRCCWPSSCCCFCFSPGCSFCCRSLAFQAPCLVLRTSTTLSTRRPEAKQFCEIKYRKKKICGKNNTG